MNIKCVNIKSKMNKLISLASPMLLVFLFFSCQSTGDTDEIKELPPPPAIEKNMPLNDALDAAILYGGETLHKVKALIDKRDEWIKVEEDLYPQLKKKNEQYSYKELIYAMHLYQVSFSKKIKKTDKNDFASLEKRSLELFETMIQSDRVIVKQAGWRFGAAFPSKSIKNLIETHLARALVEGTEKSLYTPQVAQAIAANQLIGAYTFARQGLLETGNEEFAKAMIGLNPKDSSNDFLSYLVKAPVEELRQINMTAVNVYTCLIILRHLINYPATVSHPNFEVLFLYAVSRNNSISELSQLILENHFSKSRSFLAFVLARMPVWVQVAFVESAQHKMSPVVGLFLKELKKTSPRPEVVEEINNVRF